MARSPAPSTGPAPDWRPDPEHLRILVETQPDYAVFLLDPEGYVRSWNLGAERVKGYTADEIIGEHFSRFYPPEALERGHPSRVLALALQHGHHAEEGWRVRKDGSRFWASIVISALRDEDQRLIGFGKLTRDLTSRRLAEQELRDSAERLAAANAQLGQFRLLVSSVIDYAIFLLDPAGYIRSWNIGAERMKGYTEAEAVGRHFSMFYSDEARARDHPGHELTVAAREGRFEEEGWRLRKDGSMFWANVVITALRDTDGTLVGFAKVTRDLTERRAAELRLAEAERRSRMEAERQRRRAAAIELVGRAIVARLDLGHIVQTASDAATELTGAAVAAFRYDVEDAEGTRRTLHVTSGVERDRFAQTLLRGNGEEALRGGEIVRCEDAGPDAPLRSRLAVPVITSEGEVAGAMLFGHPDPRVFDGDAEHAAVSIAASAAVAIGNTRLLEQARREVAAREAALAERDGVARALQESLLPPGLPDIEGVELGAQYHAGTELVGGDFYDLFALGDGRWGIVLGDVCGSGVEAAAKTALARHTARTAAMFDSRPATVLEALNAALVGSGDDRFTTAVFACLRTLPDGRFAVALASAGHPPGIVCRADGTTEDTLVTGPLLGVFDEIDVAEHELVLSPGDTLMLYTDGLVEARRDGKLFGGDRVRRLVRRLRHLPPDRLATELVEAALRYVDAPVSDDIAVVVLRAK